MAKAERGNLFNIDDRHDTKSSKATHCSFSKYRVILYDLLMERMGDNGPAAFRAYSLSDLGINYDDDLTVEQTADLIQAAFDKPKVTVVLNK